MKMELKLVSAGDDIKVWDRNSCLVKQYNPHNQNVSNVSWSTDNNLLGSVSVHARTIELMSMKTMTTASLEYESGCLCIDFNDTSRYMLSGASDGVIAVWDLKSKKIRKTYKDHKGPVTCARFNYNSSSIGSGSETGEVIIYNVVTGQGCRPMTTPNVQAIQQVQYNRHKKSLLGAVSDDGGLNLWDCNTRQLLHHSGCHRAPATGLSFSPINNIFLMTVGLDKRVVCHDIQSKTVVKTMDADSPLTSIDTMQDGVTVAVGTTRGKIYQYDLRMGSVPIRNLEAHQSSVQALRFQFEPQSDVLDGSKSSLQGSKPVKSRQLPVSPDTKPQPTDTPLNKHVSSSLQASDVQNSGSSLIDDVFSPLREGYQDQPSDDRVDYQGSLSMENTRNDTGEGYAGGVFSPLKENHPARNVKISPLAQPFTPLSQTRNNAGSSIVDYNSFSSQSKVGSGSFIYHKDFQEAEDGHPEHRTPLNNNSIHIHEPPDHIPVSHNDSALGHAHMRSGTAQIQLHTAHQDHYHNSSQNQNSSHKQVAFATEESDPYAFLTASSSGSSDTNSPEVKRQRQTRQEHQYKVGVSASPHFPSMQLDESPGSVSGSELVKIGVQPPTPEGVNAESASAEVKQRSSGLQSSAVKSRPAVLETKPTIRQQTDKLTAAVPGDLTSVIRTVVQEEFGAMKSQMMTVIRDEIEDRADQLHSDIINLQAEMLRMFQIQQAELSTLIQHYSVNHDLVAEVESLREEVKRLKKIF